MEAINFKNFCLKCKKMYIYGAGITARFAASELERLGFRFEAFVVSDGITKNKILYDHKILYLSEIDPNEEGIGFVLGLNKETTKEVLKLLKEKGYHNCFPLTYGTIKNNSIQRLSLYERCKLVEEYSRCKFNIAALLCDYDEASQHTYRYRAYNIHQLMYSDSYKWKFVYFFIDELGELERLFPKINVITLLRLKWTFELEGFVRIAKDQNICILYDMDDLAFDIDYLPVYMDTTNRPQTEDSYQRTFSTVARNFLLASRADGFIATNQYLAKMLINKFSQPCAVIPNFLNHEQLEIAEQCYVKTAKKDFVIGYFSGAHVHTKDFRTCSKEIMLLMEEFPNIKLKVVGYMDFPIEMEAFLENGRIENVPFVYFEKLQKLVSEVDVNIVPLNINEFTHCKSELKFFEAAIVKTVTCASPTFVFRNCINDGVNGFLCYEGDWYKKIKKIYLGEFDIGAIRDNAYLYTLQNYTGQKIIETIENVYSVFNDMRNL